jgi:hypothetical protein
MVMVDAFRPGFRMVLSYGKHPAGETANYYFTMLLHGNRQNRRGRSFLVSFQKGQILVPAKAAAI